VEVNSYLSISKISVTIQFQNFDEGFNKIIDKLGFPPFDFEDNPSFAKKGKK